LARATPVSVVLETVAVFQLPAIPFLHRRQSAKVCLSPLTPRHEPNGRGRDKAEE
jgi:hypothetical protein